VAGVPALRDRRHAARRRRLSVFSPGLSISSSPVRRTLDDDTEREASMQYALLIYDDERTMAAMSEDERSVLHEAYGSFTQELQAAGAMAGGAPLDSIRTATSVRVRDGETLTTDGPFAETKEQLGGFYLVDVPSLDEALEWAAKIPSARIGTIEVRPVPDMAMSEAGAESAAEVAG
jgi:hypothetical protein